VVTNAFDVALVVESAGAEGQDRASVAPDHHGVVIALADGAGGTGGGEVAAQAVVDAVANNLGAADFAALLADLDSDPQRLGHGQTTAVVLRVASNRIVGASVGDSGAWIIADGVIVDLTGAQQRKPLLGSGCLPIPFEGTLPAGATLIVASDGLLRYAKRTELIRVAASDTVEAAASALLDLVRLPSGRLQDDVSIVVCRHR
jgi:serine/threonine protein phosphatase PrpC